MPIIPDEYLLEPPDWKEEVSLRKIWKTNIKRTLVGGETRSALFSFSRSALEFTLLSSSAAESNRIERKIYKNLHKIWAVPYWMDLTSLSSNVSIGNTVITLTDITYATLKVGSLCVIFTDADVYEVCEIASVSGNQVTIVTPLIADWYTGASFAPLLKGIIESTQKFSFVTGTISSLSFKITETVDPYITQIEGSSSYITYKDVDVFSAPPHCSDDRIFGYDHPYNLMQFIGIDYLSAYAQETTISIADKYRFLTRQELADFVSFFDYKKGSCKSFWLSSFKTDIVATAAFTSVDSTITIEKIDWLNSYAGNKFTGRYVNIRFPNGNEIYRKIVAEPFSTLITFDSPLGQGCTISELPYLTISFLHMARFSMDEISINFITQQSSELSLGFKTISNMLILTDVTSDILITGVSNTTDIEVTI